MLAVIADAKDDLFAIRYLIVFVFCCLNRISAIFPVNQNNCPLVWFILLKMACGALQHPVEKNTLTAYLEDGLCRRVQRQRLPPL
jgi:hypothetical protein